MEHSVNKTLAGFTHLVIYRRLPRRDCRSVLLQYVLLAQFLHMFMIWCNFWSGIEIVRSTVLNNIPKQTTEVLGVTNFSWLIF